MLPIESAWDFNIQYILHFLANWKKYITEAAIPGCYIQSSFKQGR